MSGGEERARRATRCGAELMTAGEKGEETDAVVVHREREGESAKEE